MLSFSASPRELVASGWRHRQLISHMTRREIIGRYRGSVLGLLWSFFNPVLMLAVYTFVFSVVFKARWDTSSDSRTEFALVLFAGLLVFNFFAECVNRAPSLVISNTNYVKRVVFPLEVLPWVAVGSAMFHMLVNFVVWLAFYLVFFGLPHVTLMFFPLLILPLVALTVGVSWLLASLGVYLRDVAQIVGIITSVLMFLTPIFYPITALPQQFRDLMYLNPLASIIEEVRAVLIWGAGLNLQHFGILTLTAVMVAWLGFAWFQKTRKGFADVL
jgi:lipopolysaccharide transport system permease protein